MTQTVSLVKVCKSFQEGTRLRPVLSELSMQMNAGETVALLGASGSGKSTLLNILGGLTLPDSGTLEISGVRIDGLNSTERAHFRRSKIGFVFQFFHLIPTLTVEENLRLPLQLNGADDQVGRDRVKELLERVGLSDRADTFPDRLSGGEQQRVAVCRALVHRPVLVLADEPTGNLDEEAARSVLALILQMCKKDGASLLLVTHSLTVAQACERTLHLRHGSFEETAVTP